MAYCKRLYIVENRSRVSALGERNMREKLTSWDAYLAGKMRLPPRYELEYGTDVLLLRRAEGSAAAAFSARGVAPSEVVWIAEEDYRTNGKSSA